MMVHVNMHVDDGPVEIESAFSVVRWAPSPITALVWLLPMVLINPMLVYPGFLPGRSRTGTERRFVWTKEEQI